MRLRIVIPLFALVVLVAGMAIGLLLLSARNSLTQGVDQMRRAEAEVHLKSIQAGPDQALARTQQDVVQAHSDFRAASNKLDPFAPVLERLSWLPRIGQEAAAAPAAARTAGQVSAGMLPLLRGLQRIVAGFRYRHGAHTSIKVLVSRLAAAHGDFDQSCRMFHRAQRTRAALSVYHAPQLTAALKTIDRQLPTLLRVCTGLTLAPGLLGYPHSRSYFLAYQDPEELRATGGFIGSVGLVSLHHGITRQQFGSTGFDQEN